MTTPHLNARTGLGPQVKLYRGDTLLATFVDEQTFKVIMNTTGVVEFNNQFRAFLTPLRYPNAHPQPQQVPVQLAEEIDR